MIDGYNDTRYINTIFKSLNLRNLPLLKCSCKVSGTDGLRKYLFRPIVPVTAQSEKRGCTKAAAEKGEDSGAFNTMPKQQATPARPPGTEAMLRYE